MRSLFIMPERNQFKSRIRAMTKTQPDSGSQALDVLTENVINPVVPDYFDPTRTYTLISPDTNDLTIVDPVSGVRLDNPDIETTLVEGEDHYFHPLGLEDEYPTSDFQRKIRYNVDGTLTITDMSLSEWFYLPRELALYQNGRYSQVWAMRKFHMWSNVTHLWSNFHAAGDRSNLFGEWNFSFPQTLLDSTGRMKLWRLIGGSPLFDSSYVKRRYRPIGETIIS